jgi:hypothetical protein
MIADISSAKESSPNPSISTKYPSLHPHFSDHQDKLVKSDNDTDMLSSKSALPVMAAINASVPGHNDSMKRVNCFLEPLHQPVYLPLRISTLPSVYDGRQVQV